MGSHGDHTPLKYSGLHMRAPTKPAADEAFTDKHGRLIEVSDDEAAEHCGALAGRSAWYRRHRGTHARLETSCRRDPGASHAKRREPQKIQSANLLLEQPTKSSAVQVPGG